MTMSMSLPIPIFRRQSVNGRKSTLAKRGNSPSDPAHTACVNLVLSRILTSVRTQIAAVKVDAPKSRVRKLRVSGRMKISRFAEHAGDYFALFVQEIEMDLELKRPLRTFYSDSTTFFRLADVLVKSHAVSTTLKPAHHNRADKRKTKCSRR